MPLWVGVLLIGLMETFIGIDLIGVGFGGGAVFLSNSIWFALLFIPTLFYSPQYRKAVLVIYSITTIFCVLGLIGQTIGMAMLMSDEETFDKFMAESQGYAASMMWGPMAGDKVAYAHVIEYIKRNTTNYRYMQADDADMADYERTEYMNAMIGFQVDMWVNLVFLRIFYNIVIMKWQKEGEWLKQASGEETAASHPCRPMCCKGM